MTTDASMLLRKLAGASTGVRMTGQTPDAPAAPSADFATLLSKAQGGALNSNLPVTLAPRTDAYLEPEQLQRISSAADAAQAAGMETAAVLIDGKAFVLDVRTRQITGRIDAENGPVTRIDGVIAVPDLPADAAPTPLKADANGLVAVNGVAVMPTATQPPRILPLPGVGVPTGSLAELMAKVNASRSA
ncbi:MAG: hypothetical protein LW650_09705 [Planctomycetaceae bacterium]|jgi:hypothetical protein|nr:hypothetical protein [Phycisphaerales bacterium]MCE2653742.1 hypothetical protein [Planctomycetaceae bacterium]